MFDTHKCNEKGFTEIKSFKSAMANAVRQIEGLLGDGRDAAIFKTKLEEAVFFGTKAIASKTENHFETIPY